MDYLGREKVDEALIMSLLVVGFGRHLQPPKEIHCFIWAASWCKS